MENYKNLVSIIIPVYNVETYLNDCVESVLNQTYNNIEVILVDDGSTDACPRICDQFKAKDSRVKVIHKKNGGLSSARNNGIDICNGKWLYFLDSDDLIRQNTIEKYVRIVDEYNCDAVIGTLDTFVKLNETRIIKKENNVKIYDDKEVVKLMLLDNIPHCACGKLLKKELFTNIRFPEGILYEDLATMFYVMCNCKKVAFCKDKHYLYRVRNQSIMNKKITSKDLILLDLVEKVSKDMVDRYPTLEEIANRKIIVEELKLYSRILETGFNTFPNYQERIKKTIKLHYHNFLRSGLASKNDVIKLMTFRLGKVPFYLAYEISNRVKLKNA